MLQHYFHTKNDYMLIQNQTFHQEQEKIDKSFYKRISGCLRNMYDKRDDKKEKKPQDGKTNPME
ncbi:hypothetical protein BD560DRAFT_404654 [Blakeslea trispora]|nr:hypothetical protein BD560DRAFT_404654 [Blakeslea trispora]